MFFLASLWLACFLDLLIGDPVWLYHPVRIIGFVCAKSELWSRRFIKNEKIAGTVVALFVLSLTGAVSWVFFWCLALISPFAILCGSVWMLFTTIATRDLLQHSKAVYSALIETDLSAQESLILARKRVAMIVGRDTDSLNRKSIIRACVESVSESMSDGVIAPLFWAFCGALAPGDSHWAPAFAAGGAMLYKAANTMDSMFGYKNEQYYHFGWFAARLDDLLNIIPARLSGFFLVVSCFLTGLNAGSAWKVMRRDSRLHTSPNAGFPEAAMAGALGLELGGANYYFGELIMKPVLGDNMHDIMPIHIQQANVLMLTGSLLSMIFLSFCYYIFVIFL